MSGSAMSLFRTNICPPVRAPSTFYIMFGGTGAGDIWTGRVLPDHRNSPAERATTNTHAMVRVPSSLSRIIARRGLILTSDVQEGMKTYPDDKSPGVTRDHKTV